jgi:hypothetical protein
VGPVRPHAALSASERSDRPEIKTRSRRGSLMSSQELL